MLELKEEQWQELYSKAVDVQGEYRAAAKSANPAINDGALTLESFKKQFGDIFKEILENAADQFLLKNHDVVAKLLEPTYTVATGIVDICDLLPGETVYNLIVNSKSEQMAQAKQLLTTPETHQDFTIDIVKKWINGLSPAALKEEIIVIAKRKAAELAAKKTVKPQGLM